MWTYNGTEIDKTTLEDYVGFVYCITNLTNNKKYFGKKLLKFSRTKKIQGKRKKVSVASDWETYWGSNKILISDVESLGEINFTREILKFCKSKGGCNYYEAKLQFEFNVLQSDNFYNEAIMVRIHKSHLKKD